MCCVRVVCVCVCVCVIVAKSKPFLSYFFFLCIFRLLLPVGWQLAAAAGDVPQSAAADNPPPVPAVVHPGEVFHLTVMLEGGVNSSFVLVSDGSEEAGGEKVSQCTPEKKGGIVGDSSQGIVANSGTSSERKQRLLEVCQSGLVTTHEKMTNTSDLSGGVTLTPSFLAGSGRKVYVPPPDPVSC